LGGIERVVVVEVGVDVSDPRVRVVVLNFNGGEMVVNALEHLIATDYPADQLHVLCVDNCSTDGSAELVKQRLPQVEVRSNDRNLGFPGNNSALTDLDEIDYVALINSDAFVQSDWLRPLVEALESDRGLGAVCPKILLNSRYVELSVRAGVDGSGLDDVRGGGVMIRGCRRNGSDVFADTNAGATGYGREADRSGVFEWLKDIATVRIPITDAAEPLRISLLLQAPSYRAVRLDGGLGVVTCDVGPTPSWCDVDLRGEAFDVINNIGSVVLGDGYGADGGWLERDRGQFDDRNEAFAWCGGAVLLRAAYLRDVGLFDPCFFLYYEDTDLSWRGGLRGWRYETVPSSRVRHVHAASSGEASGIFAFYTERNRLLMLVKNAPLRLVLRQILRFLLVTVSYGKRDVFVPMARLRKPSFTTIHRRSSSFLGFCRLLPVMLVERRRIRSKRLVTDGKLLAGMTNRIE
jgi:GT2 family glycosyltransferase